MLISLFVYLNLKNDDTGESLTKKPLFTSAVVKRVMIGAAIGLATVNFFVIVTGTGKPI
jgi:flagellar biosynthesis protein FliR